MIVFLINDRFLPRKKLELILNGLSEKNYNKNQQTFCMKKRIY